MSKIAGETRSWNPKGAADHSDPPAEEPTPMEKLRREVRRRSDEARLFRSLSRDYLSDR